MALELDDRTAETEFIPARRKYGERFTRTAGIKRTVELARRIVMDLEREYAVTHEPLDPDRPFGITAWVYRTWRGAYIDFEVFGMVDSHLRSATWWEQLRGELEYRVAQYNWSNLDDRDDRRFGGGAVFLCTEAQERARGGRSGEVRVYRRWLSRLLGWRARPFLPVACD
jgi:hypothetical protein